MSDWNFSNSEMPTIRTTELIKAKEEAYQQGRADAIDEYKYALLNLIHQIPQRCIGGANVKKVAEQLKENKE